MSIPNLKTAAILEQKLSPSETQSPIGWKQIIAAHFIDFWMVLGASAWMKFMMTMFFSSYMISPTMRRSFAELDSVMVTACVFPIILTSYFYFSFFFNQGQTFGMNRMKIRMAMREHDFIDSYKWSVYSMKVAMTFGIFTFFAKHQPYKAHDYLYENMMVEKDWAAPSLVQAIETYEQSSFEEDYQQEAA